MRVLIVGAGGREHCLAWSCSLHPDHPELIVAPGNAGTAALAENIHVGATDAPAIAQLARDRHVDLVIVGPDNALAAGVGDACRAAGLAVFGPDAAAAKIESSKRFGKELMARLNIPTAEWCAGTRNDRAELFDFVIELGGSCVIKADGLALGKGVAVCHDQREATRALAACLNERRFGEAGDQVVVEELLQGEELSILAISDGRNIVVLPPARDYKRALEDDEGPNTGGMGSYAPAAGADFDLRFVEREIMQPVIDALRALGTPFVGCLYAGLMLTKDGPKVLEFNARFGDPETQVLLPLFHDSILELLNAAAHGDLTAAPMLSPSGAAVCVVACAENYPAPPRVGDVITGLGAMEPGSLCFHAGTARNDRGEVVTAGGRVLNLVGRGPDLRSAREQAYANLERVNFPGMRVRRDIARQELAVK